MEYPETVIELYHAHGTSEQFHSELSSRRRIRLSGGKSDMDVERLPSGKFATNATILQAGVSGVDTLEGG